MSKTYDESTRLLAANVILGEGGAREKVLNWLKDQTVPLPRNSASISSWWGNWHTQRTPESQILVVLFPGLPHFRRAFGCFRRSRTDIGGAACLRDLDVSGTFRSATSLHRYSGPTHSIVTRSHAGSVLVAVSPV